MIISLLVKIAAGVEKVTENHFGTRTLDIPADINILYSTCLFSSKETRNPSFEVSNAAEFWKK
jgi:hypothetical protein